MITQNPKVHDADVLPSMLCSPGDILIRDEGLWACTAIAKEPEIVWRTKVEGAVEPSCPSIEHLFLPVVFLTVIATTFVVKLLGRIWPSEKGGD
jgi:hypothetical protein